MDSTANYFQLVVHKHCGHFPSSPARTVTSDLSNRMSPGAPEALQFVRWVKVDMPRSDCTRLF